MNLTTAWWVVILQYYVPIMAKNIANRKTKNPIAPKVNPWGIVSPGDTIIFQPIAIMTIPKIATATGINITNSPV